MAVSDAALLDRWKACRDSEAFAELVARYSAMVYRTARRILRDPGHAEEVAQECFLLLAERSFLVRRSLGGWLHALAVSRALDRLRTERRRRARENQYQAQAQPPPQPEWNEIEALVEEAIVQLPAPLRETVICRYHQGHTLDATANLLSVSRSTVQARLEKAVTEIRRFLERRGVKATAGAIAASLGAASAEAVPVTLTAALGNLALAGTAGATGGTLVAGLATAGGLLVMKKVIVGITVGVVVAMGWWWTNGTGPQPLPRQVQAEPSAPAQPASSTEPSTASSAPAPSPRKPAKPGLLASFFGVEEDCSISGIVVNKRGVPMKGMLVLGFPRGHVETDDAGRFELTGLMPGRNELTARKPTPTLIKTVDSDGKLEERRPLPSSGREMEETVLALKAGEHRTGLKLVYTRGWTISGRATGADGTPLPGVVLHAGSTKTGGSTARSERGGALPPGEDRLP